MPDVIALVNFYLIYNMYVGVNEYVCVYKHRHTYCTYIYSPTINMKVTASLIPEHIKKYKRFFRW